MKKNIKIFILLFIVFCNMYGQSKAIKVTYVKALKKISDKSDTAPRVLKGLTYSLKANQKEGVFSVVRKMSSDFEPSNKRFIGRGGGNGIYYRNNKTKEKFKQTTTNNKLFLKEGIKYIWDLKKEKKTINNYLAFKAVAKYSEYNPVLERSMDFEIIVWYTPDIPMSFGPSGYDGLPGLVLTAQRGGIYFIASKIEFLEDIYIEKPTKGIPISDKDFGNMIYDNILKKRD